MMNEANYLTLPEELFLLSVNNAYDTTAEMHTISFQLALCSSILMELSLKGKIDTDLTKVIVVDTEPTDSQVLDIALNVIRLNQEERNIDYWINELNKKHDTIVNCLLNSLLSKKILKIENRKILWVFESLRYPLVNKSEVKDVKARLTDLLTDEASIPDLHDMLILSLLFYSDHLNLILGKRDAARLKERIEQIAKMDLIGQHIGLRLKEEIQSVLSQMSFKPS